MWTLFRKLEQIEKAINDAQATGNEAIAEELKTAVMAILDAQAKVIEACGAEQSTEKERMV